MTNEEKQEALSDAMEWVLDEQGKYMKGHAPDELETIRSLLEATLNNPPVGVGGDNFPTGAMVNGETLIDRLENVYDFQDSGGHKLGNSYEWNEMKKCFQYLCGYVALTAQQPVRGDEIRQSIKDAVAEIGKINNSPEYEAERIGDLTILHKKEKP